MMEIGLILLKIGATVKLMWGSNELPRAFKSQFVSLLIKLNPWRYSSGEPRPIEAVAARCQNRGPCG